jgi:hypothetical protein
MSRHNSRPRAVDNVSARHFQLHLFFAGWQRGRYASDGTGVPKELWRQMDSFEICEGDNGGLVFVYNSKDRTQDAARQLLMAWEYTVFLAHGQIDANRSKLQFQEPADRETCEECLRNAASDAEFLRYFAEFDVVGSNGKSFGQVNAFCVRDHDGT